MREEWLVEQSPEICLEDTKVARKDPTFVTESGINRRKLCDNHQSTLLANNKIHLSVLLSLPKKFTGPHALQGRKQG